MSYPFIPFLRIIRGIQLSNLLALKFFLHLFSHSLLKGGANALRGPCEAISENVWNRCGSWGLNVVENAESEDEIIWLVVFRHPSENMKVSWDSYSEYHHLYNQYMEKKMFQTWEKESVPNHQPVIICWAPAWKLPSVPVCVPNSAPAAVPSLSMPWRL